MATAEERQRLARELHDAVTQTLFSASLIAEVVPRLWERDPAEARERLEELRRLTRGALAEMRTLLLELRPAALVETPFARAAAPARRGDRRAGTNAAHRGARRGRTTAPLPPEVQIALYRIAQEALNNIGKHAARARAGLDLSSTTGRGRLASERRRARVRSASTRPAGIWELGIMRERARAIGARLRIESRPAQVRASTCTGGVLPV